MPMKAEEEDSVPTQPSSSNVTEDAPEQDEEEEDVLNLLAEEDNKELKRTDPNASLNKVSELSGNTVKPVRPNVPNYPCTRCKKSGHFAKNCPTIGDPSYDTEQRLSNVPKTTITKVSNLDGVDTTGKQVSAFFNFLLYGIVPLCSNGNSLLRCR